MTSFELFVALRYLLARRKQAFISLISLISVLGVAVGVMALLIALALMTGLQGELRDRIIGSAAHVYVFKAGGIEDVDAEIEKMRQLPRVQGAAPALVGKAMITSEKSLGFIDVKGIDPVREMTVTQLQSAIRKGSAEALERGPDDVPGILIGTDLAEVLEVKVGDRVQLISPHGTMTPLGMFARPRPFEVVGVFSLGLYQFDSEYGFITHGRRQARVRRGPAGLPAAARRRHVPLQRGGRRDRRALRRRVHAAGVERHEQEPVLGAVAREDGDLDHHRPDRDGRRPQHRRLADPAGDGEEPRHRHPEDDGQPGEEHQADIHAAGADHRLVGTAAGAIAGYGLIFLLDRYKLISVPVDVYQISYVPFKLQPLDFIVVIVSAILICFVATIYPSRQAARLDPAQALRYQ